MAININHKTGSISSDNNVIYVGNNSCVKIGTGAYLEENPAENSNLNNDYEGLIRYNPNLKELELCIGDSWVSIQTSNISTTTDILYSLLF